MWDYYAFSEKYKVSLEEYALSPKKGKLADRKVYPHIGRNQMMWDFGLDPKDFDNDVKIDDKIKEIEETFDLVLMTENFNQSIVLLKQLLCWDYDDLTSLKLNAHEEGTKSKLSQKAKMALKEWLRADYKLYNHFKIKFDTIVENIGQDFMANELEKLRTATDIVTKRCVKKHVANRELSPKDRLYGSGVMAYKLNEENESCQYYAMDEQKFLDLLRKAQTQRLVEENQKNQ